MYVDLHLSQFEVQGNKGPNCYAKHVCTITNVTQYLLVLNKHCHVTREFILFFELDLSFSVKI